MTQFDRLKAASLSTLAAAQRLPPSLQGAKGLEGTRPFDEVLRQAVLKEEEPSFSKHAQVRMCERQIDLTEGDMLRLQDAIGKALQKGVQKTLVLMDQRAFIVSVPDNTVVTAMNGRDIKENVFTQIDGAVIV